MKSRGSISVFFSIITPFILVVLMILTELSYYHFILQREITDNYIDLDNKLSGFHRELFSEMGLLALEAQEGLYPLSDKLVLEKSILLLMEEAQLRDGIYKAEDLSSEFLESKLGLEFSLFDLGELNRELSDIVAKAKKGELSDKLRLEFFARALAMSPYVHLKGLSLGQLEGLLIDGNLEEIEKINPIFVLDEDLRKNYQLWREKALKYDVLNILDSYSLADYGIDYLGYSMTKKDIEDYRSEFLVTGLAPGGAQESLIKAELFGIRLLLNLGECFFNPLVTERILSLSGGDPGLFTLFALGQASMESGVDLIRLMKREKVPLYKGSQGFSTLGKSGKYPSGWTYPDYLKLILGLTPRSLYLARMLRALEHNYNLNLDLCFTGLESSRQISFKGRFIPFKIEREIRGGLYYVKPEGEP